MHRIPFSLNSSKLLREIHFLHKALLHFQSQVAKNGKRISSNTLLWKKKDKKKTLQTIFLPIFSFLRLPNAPHPLCISGGAFRQTGAQTKEGLLIRPWICVPPLLTVGLKLNFGYGTVVPFRSANSTIENVAKNPAKTPKRRTCASPT